MTRQLLRTRSAIASMLALVGMVARMEAQPAAGKPVGPAAAAKLAAVSPLTPPAGGALVWYFGSSGYAVRTRDHLLIFDYQEKYGGAANEHPADQTALASGWVVPDEIKGLKVRVFVSHAHDDHFDPVIFGWRRAVPDIQYYLGFKPNESGPVNLFLGPRTELKQADLEVATIDTQFPGAHEVAWLVKVDGLVIYHNGDCELRNPGSEHDFLKTRSARVDLAFVQSTLTMKGKATPQTEDFFRKLKVGAAFPLHREPASPEYFAYQKAVQAQFPGVHVHVPTTMGERFVFSKGRIVSSSGGAPATTKKGTRS